MKKFRIVLSAFLALVLIFTLFIPSFAANVETVISVEPPKNYKTVSMPENTDPTVNWEGLVGTLRSAVIDQTSVVDIESFGIAYTQDNIEYIKNLIYDTPALLRAIGPFSYSVMGNIVTALIFDEYTISGSEYEEMYAACEDAKTTLLYGIRDNDALSDAEKCLLLHDRLAGWCEYDYQNLLDDSIPESSYSAYGALGLHYAVCQGYSYAYQWMLDDLGIENYCTDSDMINHAWNMVYIDGKPYYTDVTYDDLNWDISGRIVHNNILLSFSKFSENHDGATDFSDEADSTLYEDAFWFIEADSSLDSINTEIVFINGKFYYFAPVGNTDYALMSRAADGTTETVKTFTYKWTTASGSFFRRSARLTQYGDKLLYSTPSDIRLFDPATETETVVYAPELASGECVYGFTQINGNLIVEKNTTASFTADTKKNGQITQSFCADHTNRELLETFTEATTTTAGSGKYICADCRKVFTDVIPVHEHSYGEWTEVTAPTCHSKGSKTRTCTTCGDVDTGEIEIAPDDHAGGTEVRNTVTATCASAGYTGDTYCLGCGVKLSDGTSTGKDAANHTGGTEFRNAVTATCTTAGNTGDAYCLGCGVKLSDGTSTGKDASNHVGDTEIRNAVTATCSTEGYTGDTYCLGCGNIKSQGTSTGRDASNHVGGTENREAKAATCVEDGYEAGVICLGCNTYISGGAKISVNKKAHPGSYVSKPAKAPDCMHNGYTEEQKCVACGLTLVYSEPIPAPGHDYQFVKTVAPTCSAQGYDEYKCSVCFDVTKDNYTDTTAHSYAAEVVAPTCTKAGYTVHVCTVCRASYKDDETPAAGHKDADGDQICDVCSADLSPEATCTCKCHKGGIAGFFFKIKVFFWKLFGMEQKRICECGKAHW